MAFLRCFYGKETLFLRQRDKAPFVVIRKLITCCTRNAQGKDTVADIIEFLVGGF